MVQIRSHKSSFRYLMHPVRVSCGACDIRTSGSFLGERRKLHPRTREKERGGERESNFRPLERRLGRIPVAVFSELTTRASKWKWNANRIHCV